MKPKKYSYSDGRNMQGGGQQQRSSWYKPRDDMDKRRSCANCGSADHHVADCTTYKQGMKRLGYAPDEEDMSQASPKLRGTPIIALSLGERNLWMSFLVVENLDESDQFNLGRDFIRNFDVTKDLNNAMFRIRNPEKNYVIKPVNLIMAIENKAPVLLSRRVRMKANEAAIVSLRMKNYNKISDIKQVCIIPNPNSQNAAILGRSFSITKSGLCVSVLLNTLDLPITTQRGRKLGYALPVKTRYETIENSKQNEVVDCPNHRDKICILRRLQKINDSSGLIKSLKSETDDGLSSCSNFPERPTLDEMLTDKPVLPEIDYLRGKLKDEQLEAIKDVLERNEEVFSRHKA